ncbi:uncharacterized protein C8Q71DRAFT_145752 [Rhodofomes roseus]|uniref:DUF6534 domain-containing protein n=1 Tax=Rhodofomes roseus TaxID=34475 RepID=A0ABQ8KAK6_9APHY|nr:uncharacterized protein C8Q71DRAFT_145752 [Rhodofomes roseus]KAH9834525.1 hypothetical protein C8Q71DRAFT_145752 [Rhodofomes roseus]
MSSPPALDGLLGATFIGIILSTIIYGVTCMQVYSYYTQHSRRDGRGIKIYVAIQMALDSLHVALLVTTYYYYTVTHFGDYVRLQADTWSLSVQSTVGGALSSMAQLFFAYRLYKFNNKNLWLPITICSFSIAQLGCSFAYTVVGYNNHYFDSSPKATAYVAAALVADIVCDSMIAASTIYILHMGRTGFSKTNRVINLLIAYALNTCLLTTVFTAICLIIWYTSTDTLIYSIFYFILVRLYSCSIVSTLNTRDGMKHFLDSGSHELFNIRPATAVTPDEGSSGQLARSKGWVAPQPLTIDTRTDDIVRDTMDEDKTKALA